MDNVFRTSSAPYVMVLLISVLGWLVANVLERSENVSVIQYTFEKQTEGNSSRVLVTIENKSLFRSLNRGIFRFECGDAKSRNEGTADCLADLPSGFKAQYASVGNVDLPSNPFGEDKFSVAAPALVPPGGTVGYLIGIKDLNTPMRLVYVLDASDLAADANAAEFVLTDHRTMLGFLLSNFLSIISWSVVVLVVTLTIWLVVEFIRRNIKPKNEPEKIVLRLTVDGGEMRHVTVEEV